MSDQPAGAGREGLPRVLHAANRVVAWALLALLAAIAVPMLLPGITPFDEPLVVIALEFGLPAFLLAAFGAGMTAALAFLAGHYGDFWRGAAPLNLAAIALIGAINSWLKNIAWTFPAWALVLLALSIAVSLALRGRGVRVWLLPPMLAGTAIGPFFVIPYWACLIVAIILAGLRMVPTPLFRTYP